MSLKILGGLAKGHPLLVPDPEVCRPTLALLKRRLFDGFQDFERLHFIDACAGTGSIGLEAWSRGAASVHFVEKQTPSFVCLKKNVEAFRHKFPAEATGRPLYLCRLSIEKWLEREWKGFQADLNQVGVFYFDPPYLQTKLYKTVLEKLAVAFPPGWDLWVESDEQKGPSLDRLETWLKNKAKIYRQGTSYIAIVHF